MKIRNEHMFTVKTILLLCLMLLLWAFNSCDRDDGGPVNITDPPDGSHFEEGEVITFKATIKNRGPQSPISYIEWSSDINGRLYIEWSDNSSRFFTGTITSIFSTSALQKGRHRITCYVAFKASPYSSNDSITITVGVVDEQEDGDEEGQEEEEEKEIDLSPFNRVEFFLQSNFESDEIDPKTNKPTVQPDAVIFWDRGQKGFFGENTYHVDEKWGTEPWETELVITINLDDSLNITKIDHTFNNKDTESGYREEEIFKTKSGIKINPPKYDEVTEELVYKVEGSQVCNVVDSYSWSRYRMAWDSGEEELFDYVKYVNDKNCYEDSELLITFYSD